MRKHLKSSALLATAALALSATALPAFAQEMPPLPGEDFAGVLGAPRGVAFDEAGNLLIADAGSGGEVEVVMPGPEGESTVRLGMTGSILSVAPDGTVSTWLGNLPSIAAESETIGAYRAIPHGDSVWVIYSGPGPAPTGAWWADTIAEIDVETHVVKTVISLEPFEVANDPDGNGFDTNVADLAWGPDGTMYIADAGGNDLLSWTAEDGLAVVAAWPDNPVPTSVEVAENGDIYVGFLGAGLAPGAAKIERWSNGELAETFGGLNAVSDILLDGETLYAVQLVVFGEQGPGPGSVVTVTADGATPVVEGLVAPFGIAKGPDGALYISYGTIAFGPGMTGGVVKVVLE